MVLQMEEVDIQVNNLNGVTCLDIEGLGQGIPFEMVEKFDPYHPILNGGISFEEEKVGYMQVVEPFLTSIFSML